MKTRIVKRDLLCAAFLKKAACKIRKASSLRYNRISKYACVLATRGPVRPNPIAITACGLIGLDKQSRRIEVDWIEAENSTPVLDLKPYYPSDDRVRDVKMPDWCAHWPEWYEESGDFDWGAEFNFPE
jgi:tRNA (Thr-GGU) A37 N-methylase